MTVSLGRHGGVGYGNRIMGDSEFRLIFWRLILR